MSLPDSIAVEKIDAKHPDYAANFQTWDDISLLFRGGHALREQAQRFLTKRPKELTEVYAARVQRFVAQNILGPAIGWYQTATFCDEPEIALSGNEDGPLSEFLQDCDRRKTEYVDLWKNEIYPALLQFGCAWVLTDLPRINNAATLAEQRAAGGLNPFTVFYDPRQVINWAADDDGNLLWVLATATVQTSRFADKPTVVDRWFYFDRETFAVYEAAQEDGKRGKFAAKVDEGAHALSAKGRVPLRRLDVPEGLWLGDRVYLDLLAHLNMRNAHFWGLGIACMPQLYIKGEIKDAVTLSEVGYIGLDVDGDIGYIEPSGAAYETTAKELAALREEIYRQIWLQAQGRSSSASASVQSGYSKEMDMAPSRDVLNGFGKIVREGMTAVLTDVADAIDDGSSAEVRGLEFEDDDVQGEIATVQLAEDSGITNSSPTLWREQQKRLARKLLPGSGSDYEKLIATIEAEIDAAPTPTEQEAAQQAQLQQRMSMSLAGAAANKTAKNALAEG